MTLTAKTRQHLKAKAHNLKPVILIGSKGLTDAVKREIDIALHDHELIKIKVPCEDRDERQAMIADICVSASAELVQAIGKIGIFYRRRTD